MVILRGRGFRWEVLVKGNFHTRFSVRTLLQGLPSSRVIVHSSTNAGKTSPLSSIPSMSTSNTSNAKRISSKVNHSSSNCELWGVGKGSIICHHSFCFRAWSRYRQIFRRYHHVIMTMSKMVYLELFRTQGVGMVGRRGRFTFKHPRSPHVSVQKGVQKLMYRVRDDWLKQVILARQSKHLRTLRECHNSTALWL